jgi:hypothetical protein
MLKKSRTRSFDHGIIMISEPFLGFSEQPIMTMKEYHTSFLPIDYGKASKNAFRIDY